MFKFQLLFTIGLFFIGCNSEASKKAQQSEIKPPKLFVKMERDTTTFGWQISYEFGDQKDTIFKKSIIDYRFVDTANIDQTGLPEYIAMRDSAVFRDYHIDHIGAWSYTIIYSVMDIWSLDKKEILFSLITREVHDSGYDSRTFGLYELDSNRLDKPDYGNRTFYDYDVEFKVGEIIIKNLRKSKNNKLQPDFAEGRYRLKNGTLELIEN